MSRNPNPFFSDTASTENGFPLFKKPNKLQQHRRLERALAFVTFSSIFTGAVIVAILYISFLLQSILTSALLLLAAFFLGISVYSLNRVTDLEEDRINLPERARFVQTNRDFFLFACIESINIAVILAFFSNPSAIAIVLLAFFVGIFYSVGLRKLRLKSVLLLKNLLIAGMCTVAAVLLPLAVTQGVPLIVIMVAYFIFLKALINSVLFDVRDIEGDQKVGVRTIPIYLGRIKTRNLLLILNSTLIVWVAVSLYEGLFYPYHVVLILSVLYGFWYILHFTRTSVRTSRLFDLLVDGEWILLALYALPFALGWPSI